MNTSERQFILDFFDSLNSTFIKIPDELDPYNPLFKCLFNEFISRNHCFTDDSIQKYFKNIDWDILFKNNTRTSIGFTTREEVNSKIDIPIFQENSFQFITLDLLECQYNEGLDLEQIFYNYLCNKKLSIPFQNFLYRLFSSEGFKISDFPRNRKIGFLIISALEKINWSNDSLAINKEELNWKLLSANKGLPFSYNLIESFYKYWDWSELCSNTSVPFGIHFINKYVKDIDWYNLSSNTGKFWSEDIINAFADRLHWQKLCANQSIHWSTYFLKKFKGYIDWKTISSNENIEFSISMLETFKDLLFWEGEDWEEMFAYGEEDHNFGNIIDTDWRIVATGISANPKFPWSNIEFLLQFKSNLDWDFISTKNKFIIWNKELIETFKDKLYWSFLFDDTLSLQHKKANIEFDNASKDVSGLNFSTHLIFNYSDVFYCETIFANENIEWTFELLHKLLLHLPTSKNLSRYKRFTPLNSTTENNILPETTRHNLEIDTEDFFTIKILKIIAANKKIFDNVFQKYLTDGYIDSINLKTTYF